MDALKMIPSSAKMETMTDMMAENENARPADYDFSGLYQVRTTTQVTE
jgi:hypothetical protein